HNHDPPRPRIHQSSVRQSIVALSFNRKSFYCEATSELIPLLIFV
ncbi:8632_t:CDS:1, partial [Funneliformis mosseae]